MNVNERAHDAAERAHELMRQPATLEADDWLLIATLLIEADEALEATRHVNPEARLPALETAMAELRDITGNFTNTKFLNATRPARRRRPAMFG